MMNSVVFGSAEAALGTECFSRDQRLNKLLLSVMQEVRGYAEDQIRHIRQLTQIGIALSVEKDINKLLERIVDEARDLSRADAGTLYIIDKERLQLRFEILQNSSMKTRLGGTSGHRIALPPVPLYKSGKPNHSNVSSYAALTGETVNISDVYKTEGFDFTGARKYDAATGYRSMSMLVIPMKNHENEIIGVLQLLNAIDSGTGAVIPFSNEYVDLIGSLASQAAVALTNTLLIQDFKNLLYAFIKSIAAAIDEKSPYTGGHITRVVELTMMIAQKINETGEGPFAAVFFTEDELEELRLATWMHDVGKITTPEYVVDKSTKLETIFDRIHLIETRFRMIAAAIENEYLRRKLALKDHLGPEDGSLDAELAESLAALRADWEFVAACNNPGESMGDEKLVRLEAIAGKSYRIDGAAHPYITPDELRNLSIRRGSLTEEERRVIENHAEMTLKILNELPFPRKFSQVPIYAGGHHEKMNGSGYPRRLTREALPLQTRIIAIADIFESLTAKDRPYKKPMPLSLAVKVMGEMNDAQFTDPELFDLFIESGIYLEYARRQMAPEQIDIPEIGPTRAACRG